ncbi:MAG TPA: ABC transporter ATP-binding protein [Herpetosiphonaceae bacterium]
MADQAIYISNLSKAYGSLRVLRGVDLDVTKGQIWGLLGPNGAGKTTLIHLILGLLKPDDGTLRVFESEDRTELSARIGYLPERPRYHVQFTGREYLSTLGRLSNLGGKQLHDRVDAVLDLVGLGQSADRRIGTYSKGMLQRIGIAQAVLHEPDLLIVDEPASGLDPGGQREMALLMRALNEAGHTIFLCTHQLTDVARLCDHIGVLVGGKIAQTASVAALHAQGHSVTVRVVELPLETAHALHAIGPEVRCDRMSVTLFPTSDALLAAVLRRLLDDGVSIESVVPEADALEQFYLNAVRDGQAPPSTPAAPHATPEELLETLIEDR